MYVRLMTDEAVHAWLVSLNKLLGRRPQMPNVRVLKFAESTKGGPVKTGI